MGVATTRTMDRIAAATGMLDGAELSFQCADDIPNGGVLCALPALMAIGLLRHAKSIFTLPPGFYPMECVFLLLAYLALGRIPSLEQLAANPLLQRFTLVFDREGYSPDFFARLKILRIAVLTYHKHPGPDWEISEFSSRQVTLRNGDTANLQLAERGTLLSNGLWVRELRRLDQKGHQTSIITTEFRSDIAPAAAAMFARWHQENFFKYMRQHYGLDRLVEQGT